MLKWHFGTKRNLKVIAGEEAAHLMLEGWAVRCDGAFRGRPKQASRLFSLRKRSGRASAEEYPRLPPQTLRRLMEACWLTLGFGGALPLSPRGGIDP